MDTQIDLLIPSHITRVRGVAKETNHLSTFQRRRRNEPGPLSIVCPNHSYIKHGCNHMWTLNYSWRENKD